MNCHEFRQQLTLAEGSPGVSYDTREHLEGCRACQRFVRENEQLRALLRDLARTERAPESLRWRVQAILKEPQAGQTISAGTQWRPSSRAAFWSGIAAAVLLAAMAGYGFHRYRASRSPTPDQLAQDFILDHQHYLPGRDQIVSPSAREVESWFAGRVEFSVRVPEISLASIEDARLCDIAGRKAALVHYRRQPDRALISLFVAAEPEAFEKQKHPAVAAVSDRGLNSRLWCHRGLVYSLVAPLDDTSLQQIAESVRQQAP